MGNHKPYYSKSAVPPRHRPLEIELTGWGERLATLLDPDDFWFARVYVEAHRVERYGVEITDDILRSILVKLHEDTSEWLEGIAEQQREREPVLAAQVVYYMRISDRVKIGYTSDLKRRTMEITPEEVVATEPGGYDIEQRRHLQFARFRTRGEWFRYEGDLKEHIAQLRTRAPALTNRESSATLSDI